MISYAPLWKTMDKRKCTQYKLIKNGINQQTINKIKNNKNVTLKTVEKLCIILRCKPNDIFEVIKDS